MEWIDLYYPGDEYVDWIGGTALNYGTVANWSRWWSLKDMLSKSYATLSKINKPITLIGAYTYTTADLRAAACALHEGAFGDLAWVEERALSEGAQAFRDLDRKYPRVRGVVFFNDTGDVRMSSSPLNWSVMQDRRTADYVARELSRLSQM